MSFHVDHLEEVIFGCQQAREETQFRRMLNVDLLSGGIVSLASIRRCR
jgi:predicted HTH domain antitoxin